jgi:hypothetical protein
MDAEDTTQLDLAMANAKAVIAVADDIESWQRLNVTAFVASGIGTVHPELIGEPYIDASGVVYPPKLGVPCRVMIGSRATLRRSFDRARERNLTVSPFVEQLFATGNDVDNRAAVAAVSTEELDIVGLAIVGPPRDVDKAIDKLRPHP